MIIDDDEDDREFLKAACRRQTDNPEFTEMGAGQPALDHLKGIKSAGYPHLLFLDLYMPGKNGYDTLTELKQNEALRQIPVMVISSSTHPKDRTRCLAAGCDQYYVKPMSLYDYDVMAADAFGYITADSGS